MANPEHLQVLELGGDKWNAWRADNPLTTPDLSMADLSGIELTLPNLHKVNFRGADLSRTTLVEGKLSQADLRRANRSGADLAKANLGEANLTGADLSQANLREAFLGWSVFNAARLTRTDLSNAILVRVGFGDVDLSEAVGLQTVKYEGPSYISVSTIFRSQGNIPAAFLLGCWLPEQFIATRNHSSRAQWIYIQFHQLFQE